MNTYGVIGNWKFAPIVTDMSLLFKDAASFNEDISGWDTSYITDMGGMFWGASVFNSDIGGWDTSRVIFMDGMFQSALAFQQDISGGMLAMLSV